MVEQEGFTPRRKHWFKRVFDWCADIVCGVMGYGKPRWAACSVSKSCACRYGLCKPAIIVTGIMLLPFLAVFVYGLIDLLRKVL